MRTTKELLQLILKEGNKKFKKGNPHRPIYKNGYMGLCGFIDDLLLSEAITYMESEILRDFIRNNKPKSDSEFYSPDSEHLSYFWKKYVWEPRKRWIKYHIKNLG